LAIVLHKTTASESNSSHDVMSELVMEMIEIAGVIALSVAVSLAGARAILTASLFLMMRGVAPMTAEVQQSTTHLRNQSDRL
jgi:hypothetical protein